MQTRPCKGTALTQQSQLGLDSKKKNLMPHDGAVRTLSKQASKNLLLEQTKNTLMSYHI
jgi:hypothetical protein